MLWRSTSERAAATRAAAHAAAAIERLPAAPLDAVTAAEGSRCGGRAPPRREAFEAGVSCQIRPRFKFHEEEYGSEAVACVVKNCRRAWHSRDRIGGIKPPLQRLGERELAAAGLRSLRAKKKRPGGSRPLGVDMGEGLVEAFLAARLAGAESP